MQYITWTAMMQYQTVINTTLNKLIWFDLNLVRTNTFYFATVFKITFLSIYLLSWMNGMLDFICMRSVQVRGTRNKRK